MTEPYVSVCYAVHSFKLYNFLLELIYILLLTCVCLDYAECFSVKG